MIGGTRQSNIAPTFGGEVMGGALSIQEGRRIPVSRWGCIDRMERIRDVVDAISVWIDFNIDSAEMFLIVIAAVLVGSVFICVFLVSVSKHRSAAELAHYGGSLRQPRSFVCGICLHRSYAESHIKRRYCVKCDKHFPDSPNVARFPEIQPRDWPPKAPGRAHRNLAERAAADRTATRV